MAYRLGIDVGTTYTAAAMVENGQVSIISLGDRGAVVPTVVFLREDEEILTGDTANRRALTEPGRVARHFKRRVGDPTPLLLGGSPMSPQALMAKMLRWTVDHVAQMQGGPPDHVTVSHPANWGPYKLDLLGQAIRMAELGASSTLTEPEAAAIYYSSTQRIDPGEVVAVYDLGGGTFDAAVLLKTAAGFEILGSPEGIEHLGGIDIDEAVFAHVRNALGGALDALDPDDLLVQAGVARLRGDCVEAKEALSTDNAATIPVLLGNVQTEVRITRDELERMVRPWLADTIAALRRALNSAGVQPGIKTVLLVGGSSRIPLVAQMVSEDLGRPVAVDAHPKRAVALGAALAADQAVGGHAAPAWPVAPPVVVTPPVVVAPPPEPEPPAAAPPPVEPPPPEPLPPPPPIVPSGTPTGAGSNRRGVLIGAIAALVIVIVAAVVLTSGGGGGENADSTTTTTTASTSESTDSETGTTLAEIPTGASGRGSVIDSISIDGDNFVVDFRHTGFDPLLPAEPGSHHFHFFFNSVPPELAGTNLPENQGDWIIYADSSPFTEYKVADLDSHAGATQMCILVADDLHQVEQDTGNCHDLPDA